MSKSDDDHTGVLLEQILDEVKAIHEVVADHPTRAEFYELRDDVVGLKINMTATQAAVKDLSRDLNEVKGDVKELKSDVSVLKSDVSELKSDMKIVKAAVTDHDGRISRLEAEAAA